MRLGTGTSVRSRTRSLAVPCTPDHCEAVPCTADRIAVGSGTADWSTSLALDGLCQVTRLVVEDYLCIEGPSRVNTSV